MNKNFQEYLQHKIKQTFAKAHKNMFDADAAVRSFTAVLKHITRDS